VEASAGAAKKHPVIKYNRGKNVINLKITHGKLNHVDERGSYE
jgi:desulfoferrodoxin (superoxide reductase-like protein)